MSGLLGSQNNSPQDSHVSSSNIVEIKKLDRIPTLAVVVQRVFCLDHLELWLNIFQRLVILLESTCSNIAVL